MCTYSCYIPTFEGDHRNVQEDNIAGHEYIVHVYIYARTESYRNHSDISLELYVII